jgi:hypothetical protein
MPLTPSTTARDSLGETRPVRRPFARPLGPRTAEPSQALIRRLALDRLRELHDDGVTMGYIARMYGVSESAMRATESELRGRRRR